MSELREKLEEIFENPLDKIILSNGNGTKYKKIVLSKEDSGFALEKFTEKQAFHERIAKATVLLYDTYSNIKRKEPCHAHPHHSPCVR